MTFFRYAERIAVTILTATVLLWALDRVAAQTTARSSWVVFVPVVVFVLAAIAGAILRAAWREEISRCIEWFKRS